ncbi:MAG: hypothetical protein ACYTG5_07885 [Planctomycetota bacterium]
MAITCSLFSMGITLAQERVGIEFSNEFVLPGEDELGWRAIPWRDSFSEGVMLADQVDKPVLLWAMNGHPLGCT